MRLDVHHYFHQGNEDLLGQILARLATLERKVTTMSAQLDTLAAAVQATTELEQSAITLIQGLAAQISELKEDPGALQGLADQLTAKAAELSAAILANTPAV